MKPCASGKAPEARLKLAPAQCSGGVLRGPESAVELMRKQLKDSPQEHFFAIHLNPRNEVVGIQTVSVGGLDVTQVDPRVVFSAALLSGATGMIIGHNHPSQNTEPSVADDQLTQQLISAGRMLSIRILDHIIFTNEGGESYSYVSHGRLKFS